ncbi:MAG: universal stress protein [Spirochaetales bacterium]|nr:universal stress protein [Spirochaetales bacterium]
MKKIVVALDFSPITQAVFSTGLELAKALGAHLTLLHVVHSLQDVYVGVSLATQEYYGSMGPLYIPDEALIRQLRTQAGEEEKQLILFRESARALDVTCDASLLQGDTAKVLVEEIKRIGSDLVILGSHGHSPLVKAILGSTSEYIMSKACCPTLIIPRRES